MKGPSSVAGTLVRGPWATTARNCVLAAGGPRLRRLDGARSGAYALALMALLTACTPRQEQSQASSGASPSRNAPKRLITAITAEPAALHRALIGGAVTEAKEITFNIVN